MKQQRKKPAQTLAQNNINYASVRQSASANKCDYYYLRDLRAPPPPQSTTTTNAKSLIFHFGGARDMKNGLFTCGDAAVLLSPVCSDAFAISTGSCYLAVCRF